MENINIKDFSVEISSSITGISRKTIEKIYNIWKKSGNAIPVVRPDIPEEDVELVKTQISECILDENTGDISRHTKVVQLAMIYIKLTLEGKEKFLHILAEDFDIDNYEIFRNIKRLKRTFKEIKRVKLELKLNDLLVPPRVKFLKKLISLPNGFIFLKDMRTDLLPLAKHNPRLKKLDIDIKNLLKTYFDVNLLKLVEVTWNSPAALLEKLMQYEAVHTISSWKDMKHRMLHDRKIYAFIHPSMPYEPVIFVEIALTNGLASNIQKLLDRNATPKDPYEVDTAIFYSISNTQKGLRGISFGNFLIKRVVNELLAEFDNIKIFSTLSPIPTFISWLKKHLAENEELLCTTNETKAIFELTENPNPKLALLEILEKKDWHTNTEIVDVVKTPLMRFCAYFLTKIKRKETRAFDPVTNFHLSNGAKIEQINWLGDTSKKGIKQSAGLMINYKYELENIAVFHEEYKTTGKIHVSDKVKILL